MTRSRRLAERMLAATRWLVPVGSRLRWEREWKAELWHRERALAEAGAGPTRTTLGVLRPALGIGIHAVWLRCQSPGWDTLGQDLRFAARSYRRSAGFTLAAVLTLGLGIGANVALLAVVEGAFLDPYPYEDADRIVVLVNRDAERPGQNLPFSFPDVDEVRRSGLFESVTAVDWDPFNLGLDDRTEWVGGGLVGASAFRTFGVAPIRGRGFLPEDDRPGGAPVVVLGERLWRDALGGRDVIGESLRLDGVPHEIVGVAPAALDVPDGADLFVPLRPEGEQATRRSSWLFACGRLAPGVTLARAEAGLATLASRIEAAHPETNEGRTFVPIPLRDYRVGDVRPAFLALLGAVAILLLVVCVNLSSLLLARASRRAGEFEVRQAIGASPGRIARQLLTECLALSAAGGAVGLALGIGIVSLLRGALPDPPGWFSPSVDASLAMGALALTAVCAVVFGASPILASLARGTRGAVRRGRSTPRSREALVLVEIALSTVLLISAGLLIRSLEALTSVDPGFSPEGRISGTVQLPAAAYPSDDAVLRFTDRLLESAESRPDIVSAALVTRMPFRSGTNNVRWWEEGQGENAYLENPPAELNSITPGYFRTMGISLREGRAFARSDDGDADGVAVINASFADRYFGERDPVGARISFSYPPRFAQIVGVVEDTKHLGLDQPAVHQIYMPLAQRPTRRLTLVGEAAGDPGAVAGGLRDLVRGLDPDLAVSALTLLDDRVRSSVWRLRLLTGVFWAFGAFALLISLVGISGTVAQSVARRTREIGVRVTLGARAGDILRLVIRRTAWLVAGGLGLGLVLALGGGRLARGTLYGVEPADPVTLFGVATGFATIAALAAWLPARRATRVEPSATLRAD